jgi:transporter family-2 protein
LLLLILGIFAGAVIPFQTSINSHLASYVKSPFLSSLISFSVGTLFLAGLCLFTDTPLLLSHHQLTVIPWWSYLGGLLGTIGLTANILLFPIIGSVQTVTMPILGQIIMSMIIDNFGWFNTSRSQLSLINLIGVVLLITGVITVVLLPDYLKHQKSPKNHQPKIIPQLIGIVVGMLLAIQVAINGHFGVLLHAPVHAALISFATGTAILFLINLSQRNFKNISNTWQQRSPWWVWLGGILGATYIFMNAFLVPSLGTGTVVVLSLLGQILSSTFVDHFGLLGAKRNPIVRLQILGLIIMIIGVVCIKML